MMMNVEYHYDCGGYDCDDDYDYDDDGYDDDGYDDDDYDGDGYDDGIVGSIVQVLEAATNTAACTPASAADPRGSATHPRFPTPANTPRTA